jgi:hypothetical protein
MFYVLVTLPKMEQYSCSVGGEGGEDDRTIIDIQVSTLGKYTTSWEYPVQIEIKTQIFSISRSLLLYSTHIQIQAVNSSHNLPLFKETIVGFYNLEFITYCCPKALKYVVK